MKLDVADYFLEVHPQQAQIGSLFVSGNLRVVVEDTVPYDSLDLNICLDLLQVEDALELGRLRRLALCQLLHGKSLLRGGEYVSLD